MKDLERVDERSSLSEEKPLSIYELDENNSEVIRQAILEHQYHLEPRQRRYLALKRMIDTCIAIVALLILAIPFLIIAIIQKICSPSESVFFLQDRMGMHDKPFKVIKFRTMKSSAPHDIATSDLENAEAYLTKFGSFLRKFSIDELPQLWNVLRGEMALIGPRPLIVSEYPAQYLRKYYGIYAVRPGITGLAQINGRDTLDDINKVRYDRAYVHNVCLRLDLMILLKSIAYVVRRKDIVEGKQEKVPGFAAQVHENIQRDFAEEC